MLWVSINFLGGIKTTTNAGQRKWQTKKHNKKKQTQEYASHAHNLMEFDFQMPNFEALQKYPQHTISNPVCSCSCNYSCYAMSKKQTCCCHGSFFAILVPMRLLLLYKAEHQHGVGTKTEHASVISSLWGEFHPEMVWGSSCHAPFTTRANQAASSKREAKAAVRCRPIQGSHCSCRGSAGRPVRQEIDNLLTVLMQKEPRGPQHIPAGCTFNLN